MSNELTTAFVAETMRARGYQVRAGTPRPVLGGAADSRKVQPGDLFTAFPGENEDGNRFVAAALEAGAAAVICSEAPAGDWPEATIVVAPDATRAVGELAHAWRRECAPQVVGITGTVGKTTAKEFTAALLSQRFKTHRSAGNFNSREGLPLALMSLRRDHEVSVLEIAMDSKGEVAELAAIAEPEVGAVLNIGLTHVSKLGSIGAIAEEKLSLVRGLPPSGTAILNVDDPRVAAAVPELRCQVITFGEAESAALRRGPITDRGLAGVSFDVTFGETTERVNSPLPGAHTVPAVLTAIAAGIALGMNLRGAASAAERAEVEGRAHIYRVASGATVIDDRYNSSPASLQGALGMLAGLPGMRIALLGRMAELGDFEAEEHRAAGRVAARSCDVLICSGETCRALADAAREAGHTDVRWFATKEEAAAEAASLLHDGVTVLVKASRGEAFETILPLLGAAA
ncbi:MAG TPA: UDP-N-acetylmuramoyl-tripeptide--D-alanyl-D-alanine ligase [Tepidiformaceae bacterium]|nr:UDP-N-acetylmuramoyl-tripeptide--D-alanyl-D-alanine ligase [Tepidiformaceae bacterium]